MAVDLSAAEAAKNAITESGPPSSSDAFLDPVLPFAQWPKLLLGPMLRRTTRSEVSVFVATSVEVSARVDLYPSGAGVDSGGVPRVAGAAVASIATSGATTLHRIGQHLWVGLIRAAIPSSVAPGQVVAYDLVLTEGTSPSGLFELGLLGQVDGLPADIDPLRAAVPIGYSAGSLPSFVVPPSTATELRIAHGSCRKPHGGAKDEPDALAILDVVIAESLGVPPAGDGPIPPSSNRERPHQLVLTGDQIYADDVAGALLQTLTPTGNELLGWEEQFPGHYPGLNSYLLQPGWRTRFLTLMGLKYIPAAPPDYPACHLLHFGEWASMYLFAWSDALWPRHDGKYWLPDVPNLITSEQVEDFIDDPPGPLQTWPVPPPAMLAGPAMTVGFKIAEWLQEFDEQIRADWEGTRPKALGYAETVRHVRRVLANTPTLTMFDDHEITDDWFLNEKVHNHLIGVEQSPLDEGAGPRLLRNGLSAYAFFQHWGNSPEDFESGVGPSFLQSWDYDSPGDPLEDPVVRNSRESSLEAVLGINPPQPIPTNTSGRSNFTRFRWDYSIEFDSHTFVALDTRTWRAFPGRLPWDFPDLAGRSTPATTGDPGTQLLSDTAAQWSVAAGGPATAAQSAWEQILVLTADLSAVSTQQDALVLLDDLRVALVDLVDLVALEQAVALQSRVAEWTARVAPSDVRQAQHRAAQLVRLVLASLREQEETVVAAAVQAVADYIEAVATGSYAAMARTARRVVISSGGDLYAALGSIVDVSGPATLALGLQVVAQQATDLVEATPIDEMSAMFFRDGGNRLGAELISATALEFMVRQPLLGPRADKPVVMLSPAPIFGNRLIEMVQHIAVIKAAAIDGVPATEEWDYEPWSASVPAMINLFEAAGGIDGVVVLSGDVHYAGSSVNDVTVASLTDASEVRTRYLQFTSSAARNADGKTRLVGYLDDLAWTSEGEFTLFQMNLAALSAGGSGSGSSPVSNFVQYYQEQLMHSWSEFKTDAELLWENREDLVRLAVLEKLKKFRPSEVAEWIATAPVNTLEGLLDEHRYMSLKAVEFALRFVNDPKQAIFGEWLYAPDVTREQLISLYDSIGVDHRAGLMLSSRILSEKRPERAELYRGDRRFTDFAEGSATDAYSDTMFSRTVGNANIGLVRFHSDGTNLSASHEILFYPDPEPEDSIQSVPSGSGSSVRKRVPSSELPRSDWLGTLHKASLVSPHVVGETP